MQILYQPASPFVAKCRMAIRHLGLDVEDRVADATAQAPELLEINPLGKIPCLVTDEGEAIYDSRTIMRFLDGHAKGSLYPGDDLMAERMEALCDGIADAAVAFQYEKRLRPEEKWHQPWLDRQWGKVTRGLKALANGDLPPVNPPDAGSFALAALLAYLDLRYAGEWQDGVGELLDWQQRFDAHHPDLAEVKPSA